jgi:LPS sulfotransferase NodH
MNGLRELASALPQPVKGAIRTGERHLGHQTSRFRLLPDYLIIGAQRAGTTSLYKYLAQHPAVGAALLGKGAHFFDTNYTGDVDSYRAHFPTRTYKWWVKVRRGLDLVTGEASPYYLAHPHAPYRIAETLPDVRLIALLRDPVERAYSHYQHELARGFETLSFEEGIDREPERLAGELEKMRADPSYNSFSYQHHSYLARGHYAEQLQAWYSLFPEHQILVLASEHFFADPDRAYQRVLEFLGVPPRSLRRYETFNPRRYEDMNEATRRRLTEHFSEPNARLYELLEADLGWSR